MDFILALALYIFMVWIAYKIFMKFLINTYSPSSKESEENKFSSDKIIAERELREQRRENFIKAKIDEFNNNLSTIPEEKIQIKDIKKLEKKYISDMNEYKFSNIRKNTNYMNFERYIVLDTETTGLSARNNELVEISMIKFEKHEPVSYMSTLIKPKREIPEEITSINGIDNNMVANEPSISQVIDSFNEYIKGYDIVGYNLNFDMKFLYVNGIDFFNEKRKFYDVLDLARKKVNKSEVYDYKLSSVTEYFDIYRDTSHRALSDAYATGLVFENILDETIDIEVLQKYYNIESTAKPSKELEESIKEKQDEILEPPWELQEDDETENK